MNKKVFIGVGHGGSDPGAVGNGLKESYLNLKAAIAAKNLLESFGVQVGISRIKDENDPVDQEVKECNAFNPTLAVDFHTNSGGGDGFEVYHYTHGGTSKILASNIETEVKAIGQNSRGLKTRVGANGKEYYAFIRDIKAPSVIVEMAFIDNLKDIGAFNEEYELKLYGEAVAKGILKTLGIVSKEPDVITAYTPIIGVATATVEQCKEWAKSKQAKQAFVDNADIYFKVCKDVGVNPVMAYTQYALETGYGSHKGTVPESYYNPCGLKVAKGGLDTDKNAHVKFKKWDEGISAHVDHIALYAGGKGYPKSNTLDTRHFGYLYGKYKTVEDIGKGWCPSNPKYGDMLLKMMQEIMATKVEEMTYIEAAKVLYEEGILDTLGPWEDPNNINPKFIPYLIIKIAKKLRSK